MKILKKNLKKKKKIETKKIKSVDIYEEINR